MNKRGRPREYLRLDAWEQFLKNDWAHLKDEVRWHTWLLLIIAVAVIGKLVIDFVWS